jgi:hypothetical protein
VVSNVLAGLSNPSSNPRHSWDGLRTFGFLLLLPLTNHPLFFRQRREHRWVWIGALYKHTRLHSFVFVYYKVTLYLLTCACRSLLNLSGGDHSRHTSLKEQATLITQAATFDSLCLTGDAAALFCAIGLSVPRSMVTCVHLHGWGPGVAQWLTKWAGNLKVAAGSNPSLVIDHFFFA